MHRPAFLVLVSFVLLHSSLQASPAEAQSVVKRYEAAMEKWSLQANAAATAEERQKVWSSRPDGAPFARELWTVIAGSLGEEWILEPAAWFIRVSAGLVAPGQAGGAPIFTKQNEMICEAVEKYHWRVRN
ncbi:MAG: hypothetical protein HC845_05195 [Akkermansiaceae bacterium]|nr:hypothetical protein [Akkermansiaceae bacterium]